MERQKYVVEIYSPVSLKDRAHGDPGDAYLTIFQTSKVEQDRFINLQLLPLMTYWIHF